MVERMVRGLDDKRRSNIPPRQGWSLCVTPYFADLGVGDMRGDDIGIPHNRTPEVVRGKQVSAAWVAEPWYEKRLRKAAFTE